MWRDFCAVVTATFQNADIQNCVGVLVAWNGKSCDLEWIYKLINSNNDCLMPPEIEYFMDPYRIIKTYAGCALHMSKSKLPNLRLSTVYEHVVGKNLDNAHDSLVDCHAQGDILMCSDFAKYKDMKTSICTIESVWSVKDKNRLNREQELQAKPNAAWKVDNEAEEWTLSDDKKFTSFQGGGAAGPTRQAKEALNFVGEAVLELIVKESKRYAYEDWVVEKEVKDINGNVKKKKILIPCNDDNPDKRKRVRSNVRDQWEFTCGYVLAWLGICICFGGLSSKQSPDVLWTSLANGGVYVPFVRNTMSKNGFKFVRQYIHFGDNRSSSNHKEDPLYKIRRVMETISNQLRLGWNANIDLSVDESMIKYKGRAIRFVQYLPKKPIKHGIKVYCLCDAETDYLIAFEVYTGVSSGSTWDIIERLVNQSNLGDETGRRLFMDNYYTTMKVVTKLYENHGWVCAGTVAQTKKKEE